jgi:hypothetical protein
MRPDIIFGVLLAVFLVVRVVQRLRRRREDWSGDGTLGGGRDEDDLEDDA